MANEAKPIGSDTVGYESINRAILSLLSSYPGLGEREVLFESLEAGTSGIAIGTNSGALIITSKASITGRIKQTCEFPFFVIYRTSADRETEKLRVADFLDTFGLWLTRQPVVLNEREYILPAYPELTGGRKITDVTVFNSYGVEPMEDGYQDWYLPVTVNYTNEFDPW